MVQIKEAYEEKMEELQAANEELDEMDIWKQKVLLPSLPYSGGCGKLSF